MGLESDINECQYYKFHKRQSTHIMMFGWVQGIKKYLPSVSISSAIEGYLTHYQLDDDVKYLEVCYQRMLAELREADKT